MLFATLLFLSTQLAAEPAPVAAPTVDPKARVEAAYAQIQAIVKESTDESVMRDRVKALTPAFVDFDQFSREALKSSWDGLDAAQRADFVLWFKRLIQATYARHFKAKQDLKIDWRGEPEYVEDKAQVATTLRFEKSAVDVDYRFQKHGDGSWWVYDIVIDEVSLARNYRGQFQRIVKKDGFASLMTTIKAAVERKEKGADQTDQL